MLGSLLIYRRYIECPLFQIFTYAISWDLSLASEDSCYNYHLKDEETELCEMVLPPHGLMGSLHFMMYEKVLGHLHLIPSTYYRLNCVSPSSPNMLKP